MFTRERFETDPNRSSPKIGSETWAFCLHETILEPVWDGSLKTGPTFLQVQFWIRSGPVSERSRVNRSRSGPVRFGTVPVRTPAGVNVA